LTKDGVPQSLVAAQKAEVQATIEASVLEAEQRKAAAAAADRASLLARLVLKVAQVLVIHEAASAVRENEVPVPAKGGTH
jgi:hypothetical protein